MQYKDFIIIILSILVIGLTFLVFTGYFCSCSPVKCPNNCPDPMRSYLT